MSRQVTKKWVNNNFKYVVQVPYCALQTVLNEKSPDYYTAGIYGWNSDIYIIDADVAISTGYRSFGNKKFSYEFYESAEKAVKSGKQTRESIIFDIIVKCKF